MKRLRVLLALALTLTLCLSVIAPTALAAPYTDGVAITKILAVPYGTEVPATMTFEFEIEAVAWDTVEADDTTMPAFADVTLDPNVTTDLATVTPPATNPYTDNGVIYCVLESGDILDPVRMTGNWPGAGKYEYKITEKDDTYDLNTPGIADHTEGMSWSGAEYRLYIYVEEDGSGGFEIVGVGVLKVTDDAAEPITGGEKVPVVTPGGDGGVTYDYSQIIFNNSYWITPDGDPEDPDPDTASLVVSKQISGAGLSGTEAAGDGDYAKFFSFAMTVIPPANVPDDEIPSFYVAYVVDESGAIIGDLSGHDGDVVSDSPDYFAFAPGIETAFSLRHGESLIFAGTPAGTAYVIEESATPYFQPNYTITTAGAAAPEVNGNTNQGLATDTEYTGLGVGMAANLAAFENVCVFNPETGLQSLPVYGLSLLALVGLIVFVVVKSRKKEETYSER